MQVTTQATSAGHSVGRATLSLSAIGTGVLAPSPPFSEVMMAFIMFYVALITQSSNCWKVNNL